MFCAKCGAQLTEAARFCRQCGAPAVAFKPKCPSCGREHERGMVFCEECGTLLKPEREETGVAVIHTDAPSPLRKFYMISRYNGETGGGIAKTTGTLFFYSDRMELRPVLGNSLKNALGPVGLLSGRAEAKKAAVERYPYADMKSAKASKYLAVMPSMVITMLDGRIFTFSGTFGNAVNECVGMIDRAIQKR